MSYVPTSETERRGDIRQFAYLPSPEIQPNEPGSDFVADFTMSSSTPDDQNAMLEPMDSNQYPLPTDTSTWSPVLAAIGSNISGPGSLGVNRHLSPNSDSAINQAPNGTMEDIYNTRLYGAFQMTGDDPALFQDAIPRTNNDIATSMRGLTPMSEADSLDNVLVQTVSPSLLSTNRPFLNPSRQTVSRNRVTNKTSKKSPTTSRVQKARTKTVQLSPYYNRDEYRGLPTPLSCSHCSIICSDKVTLGKHIRSEHTRPFQCIFNFAGCAEAFASKNEFKRHATVQHACPTYYHCTVGACANTKAPLSGHRHAHLPSYGKIFTRKDLYDEHQRRLHSLPESLSAEECHKREQELADASLRQRCELPTYLKCPYAGCYEEFEGEQAWDRMLEHVARHMELAGTGGEIPMYFSPGAETSLTSWASSEGVNIIQNNGDEWEFCYQKQARKARKSKQT